MAVGRESVVLSEVFAGEIPMRVEPVRIASDEETIFGFP